MDDSLFDFARLHAAWLDCRRGKSQCSRWQFEIGLERELLALRDELAARTWRPSPSVCFVTEQPKRREIFAAAFRDRVVHHLVVRHLEPYWERRFIHDNYACRRGKGTLAAVNRIQTFMRQVSANGSRRAFVLHLDIRSFFVRIHKETLFAILDDGLCRQNAPWQETMRWLLERIVFRDPASDAIRIGRGFNAVPEHKSLFHTHNVCGLPIGNYTSQFFANVYLDRLDQFVKQTLKTRHYLRYVDDLILMHESREQLELWETAIDDFLRRELELELNHNRRQLVPVHNGLDALGYVVHLHHRLLRRRTVRRFRQHLAKVRWQQVRERTHGCEWLPPRDGGAALMAQAMSYRGLLSHAQSRNLCRDLQREHDLPGWLWRLDRSGKVQRRDAPQARHHTLFGQWRRFCREWPNALVLMQVGRHLEAWGIHALWLGRALGLKPGRFRKRMGAGAGFPVTQLSQRLPALRALNRPVAIFVQTGLRRGRVAQRRLAWYWWPAGKNPADDAAPWLLVP